MPGKTGFDLLSELDHSPQVIFTTAYDEYALKAFEVNALDYLLKPVEPRRLADAIEKLRRYLQRHWCRAQYPSWREHRPAE
jgi:two-component system LytT family response regulator